MIASIRSDHSTPPGIEERNNKMVALIVVVAVLVVLLGVPVLAFNGLVRRRNRTREAWSEIDVELKRRHDLIPNLVETVKGYAAHERGTFENIAKFRSQAMQATTPADKAQAEGA